MIDPLGKVHERFQNDPAFHAVVTMLEQAILSLELSPSEVREAAMYAAYRVEIRRPIQIHVGPISGEPYK